MLSRWLRVVPTVLLILSVSQDAVAEVGVNSFSFSPTTVSAGELVTIRARSSQPSRLSDIQSIFIGQQPFNRHRVPSKDKSILQIRIPASAKSGPLRILTRNNRQFNLGRLTIRELSPASLSFEPSSILFGNVRVGESSIRQTVKLINRGEKKATALYFNSLTPSFVINSNSCSDSLDPKAICNLELHFNPSQEGPSSASLQAVYKDSSNQQVSSVSLSGLGIPALKPANLVFGNSKPFKFESARLGETRKKTFTLRNTGEKRARNISISVASPFLISNNPCPEFLEPNATCTFEVSFKPAQVGRFSGAIQAAFLDDRADSIPQITSREVEGVGIQKDTTPPTVTLSRSGSERIRSSSTFQILFSEDITGFDASDLLVTNGLISSLAGSGRIFSATVRPANVGKINIQIPADSVKDASGNPNSISDNLSYDFDNVPASATFSSAPMRPGQPIPIQLVFNKDVVGLNLDAISVSQGTVMSFGGTGAIYDFQVVPQMKGTLMISLSGAAIQDLFGNSGLSNSNTLSISVDEPPDSAFLTREGDLKLSIGSSGSNLVLSQETGFYRISSKSLAPVSFDLEKVRRVSVSGNFFPNQTFRLGAGVGSVLVHPLTVDSNVERTLLLGAIQTDGDVVIGSERITVAADIRSLGKQIYKGAVGISGNRILTAGASDIIFEKAVDSSQLIFADPDSAPEGTNISNFFPGMTLSSVGLENQPHSSVFSVLGRTQDSLFAPTGSHVFGNGLGGPGHEAWTFQKGERSDAGDWQGRLLRIDFSDPVRNVSVEFSPWDLRLDESGQPTALASPKVFARSNETACPPTAVPSDGADFSEPDEPRYVPYLKTASIDLIQEHSNRAIRCAWASWQGNAAFLPSLGSRGIIDNLQVTLLEKPSLNLTLFTQGKTSFLGSKGERLTILNLKEASLPPTLERFSPRSGQRGEPLTIYGNHLATVTKVSFGRLITTKFEIVPLSGELYTHKILVNTPEEAESGTLGLVYYGGTTFSREVFSVQRLVDYGFHFIPETIEAGSELTLQFFKAGTTSRVTLNGQLEAPILSSDFNSVTVRVPRSAVSGPVTALLANHDQLVSVQSVNILNPTFGLIVPHSGTAGSSAFVPGTETQLAERVFFKNCLEAASCRLVEASFKATPLGLEVFIPAIDFRGTQSQEMSVTIVTKAGSQFSAGVFNFLVEEPGIPDSPLPPGPDAPPPPAPSTPVTNPKLVFEPGSGPVGTQVTLSGITFGLATRVYFSASLESKNILRARVSSQEEGRLVVEVPSCAQPGSITIVSGDHLYQTSSSFQVINSTACTLFDGEELFATNFSGTPSELGTQQGNQLGHGIYQMIEEWVKPILSSDGQVGASLKDIAKQLGENLPPEAIEEMKAMAQMSGQSFEDILMGNVMNDSLTIAGIRNSCSTLVVMPSRSRSGAMVFGRNLDFLQSDILRKMWLPVIFRKTGKLAVLSLSVPGLIGVASGINEKGVAISHNTSYKRDEPPTPAGIASLFIIRKVLEEAKTAREAVTLYQQHTRTTSGNITITDGKEAFVLEEAPVSSRVRIPHNHVLFAVNHFVDPAMKNEMGIEDERWRIFYHYIPIEETAENYKIGLGDVRNLIEQTGIPDINVLGFVLDYKTKRLYFGSNPEKALKGDLKFVDLVDFLKP